ncbi:MAG: hypothetical protein ACTHNU_03650, partial [Gaiellales bacterium]
MLLGIAIVMFFGAAYMLLAGLTVRQREVAVSVRRARRYGARDQREIETRRSMNDRVVGPLIDKLAAITLRLLPKTDPQQVQNRLLAAGLGQSMSPQMYLAIKGGLVGLFGFGGLALAVTGVMPGALGFMIALLGGAIGFIAPDFYINSRVRGRKAIMQAELPNVLDLLCVSVEAGLGFDA